MNHYDLKGLNAGVVVGAGISFCIKYPKFCIGAGEFIIGSVTGGVICTITGVCDAANDEEYQQCPDECDPPEGTLCYESWHNFHSHKGKKPHRHTWKQNKIPGKGCRWNKRNDAEHTIGVDNIFLSLGMRPCSSYPSWVAQNR